MAPIKTEKCDCKWGKKACELQQNTRLKKKGNYVEKWYNLHVSCHVAQAVINQFTLFFDSSWYRHSKCTISFCNWMLKYEKMWLFGACDVTSTSTQFHFLTRRVRFHWIFALCHFICVTRAWKHFPSCCRSAWTWNIIARCFGHHTTLPNY